MRAIFKLFFSHLKNVVNYFKAKPLYVFLIYMYKYARIHTSLDAGENRLPL